MDSRPRSRYTPSVLRDLRDEIEAVSFDLVKLLNRRCELSLAIGAEKRRIGAPLRDPQREEELLDRLVAGSSGPMSAEALRSVFRTILDASLDAMQQTHRTDEKE